ncbi:TetR/AcrR family transcriptional regulator [Pseudoxanthomonas sp. PXM02]|uniref:TetR/AcrR family transcriptional regulator n=1 Tax=Pseudoxanthomonas sp. PXM02 TaxID=2769294 RepID=UPI0017841FB7|nr:TetR/AcrR family transcriptional regulator [Pseudoxanthomonas sp. PXM02]MBD9479640.1 TetR/AcrR family transcriptional regulator [Pseudoxanthomonas sp. PXM02]
MTSPKPPRDTAGSPAKTAPKKSAPPRKRSPGRRPTAESADLRATLLDAALACFVRKGIAATSLRDIAAEAHVTPALVHYYFGDKAQLQQAVVAERLLPVIGQMRAPLMQAGDADVAALVAGFVHGIAGVVQQHPWLPTLWVREILCEGGALRDMMISQVGPLLPKMMAGRFAAAQQAGQLNPDLDPRLLMVSLIGLTMFPMASAPIWRQLFGADDIDFNDLRRHTLVLLDRGLELDHAK